LISLIEKFLRNDFAHAHPQLYKYFLCTTGHDENCYKSVETVGGGSQLELSVSRTFIKLQDLIVEKKKLQHEIHGFKQLNKKLESKVGSLSPLAELERWEL